MKEKRTRYKTQGYGRDFSAGWTKVGISIWKEGKQSTARKREKLNTKLAYEGYKVKDPTHIEMLSLGMNIYLMMPFMFV